MDTSGMLRPEVLPFPIPQMLANDIYALIDAVEHDDPRGGWRHGLG